MLVRSDSLQSHGLWPARLLCPWNSPDKNTEVGCHSLLQGIFPTQGWNPGLLHCRQILCRVTWEARNYPTQRSRRQFPPAIGGTFLFDGVRSLDLPVCFRGGQSGLSSLEKMLRQKKKKKQIKKKKEMLMVGFET